MKIDRVTGSSIAVLGLGVAAVILALAVDIERWSGLDREELGVLAWETAPGPTDRGTLTDEYFHVEWKAGPERGGRSRLAGNVFNNSDRPARNVELRITAVDWAGQPGRTMVRPVGDTVPAKGRAHFDLEIPRSAAFTVVVDSFEFVERPHRSALRLPLPGPGWPGSGRTAWANRRLPHYPSQSHFR